MRLENHPTVQAYKQATGKRSVHSGIIKAEVLKNEALAAGADDLGLIDLERESMADFRKDLLYVMPETRTVMVLVFRLNQTPLRSLAHSVADIEFKHSWKHANDTARRIVLRLQTLGFQAINMPAGFPYEAKLWPGKM